MWVASAELPTSAGHPFYERLNRVLDDAGFDAFVEAQCAKFYADGIGRPSLAPGRYFRLLLLGYFEGLDSERAIAWRASDSLSIRQFLDFALHEAPPDHSTLSRTRRLINRSCLAACAARGNDAEGLRLSSDDSSSPWRTLPRSIATQGETAPGQEWSCGSPLRKPY